jgi:hypothetical protein
MMDNANERKRALALPKARSFPDLMLNSQYCRELMRYWDKPINPNARRFRETDLCIIAGYAFTKMSVIPKGRKGPMIVLMLDGKQIKPKVAMQMLYEKTLSEISEGEDDGKDRN